MRRRTRADDSEEGICGCHTRPINMSNFYKNMIESYTFAKAHGSGSGDGPTELKHKHENQS